MFQSIAGKANLEKADLEPSLKALEDRQMTKNAEEIAEKLCESVAESLEGKKLASFTSISSTVQAAIEEALVLILTPRRSIDILRDVHAAKEQRKPYVVVFVGVNGVGKSTNLAKVAYWFLQHEVNVVVAACDTFRSGAVEQLRTHARRLQVSIPIFEKGYEKDPAIVAKEAIQEATRNGSDVVLADTAGRMQDNEPLMRALSKLIYLNNPDLVLFVGEALVGNDAVDQLSKFNQKLAELSTSPNPRLVDGILLTKFDTIDDKVGAALSMVYISGAPVIFVGCGQSFTDLKKLSVKSIVKTLLK
ncbi:Signal recognition particle receptor subunit alpha like [Actinidia chinensis var. chinensis]|uniref:Signal recognition particle receptor subunit alpha like n=1 Tax=Actinidia chinensis var. chinensis TaxID=1590841 RepID=A0A2R6R4U9_ACTCC|nr:Signal recognition particle receptor subunit alpha like [Actinidia chinensis var. chinensis]